MGPDRLLADRVRADGATPFLTWYDETTGERVELSAVSLANWVAKTCHLLTDELEVEAGDEVAVHLPAHWQTAVLLLSLWQVGALVDLDGGPTPVRVVAGADLAAGPGLGGDVGGSRTQVLGLSLRPMAGRLAVTPAGVVDYAAEVALQPDHWAAPPLPDTTPALRLGGELHTTGGLVHAAGALGLPPRARVLSTAAWTSYPALLAGLLGPLACGGSVVLVAGADPGRLSALAAQERVTHAVGVELDGVANLVSL